MAKKFYVVWRGHIPGVYDDWADAKEQIEGYPGAKYKSYPTPDEAARAYRQGMEAEDAGTLGAFLSDMRRQAKEKAPADRHYYEIPEVDKTAWAVDAACSKNPGPIEYRGVDLATGRQIFHFGPAPDCSNNIGEFLAIVHALALMEQRGERHRIYSDSRTAISWVRNGVVKTNIKRTPRNERVFRMLERAVVWLHTHSFRVPIVKWDTDNWGEIPADFGRK